jgi:type III restriction enzyme
MRAKGHRVPPVMITVANRTESAARIKYAFDHGKIRIEELCEPDRILHIDSKVLDEAEARVEESSLPENGGKDSKGDDDSAPRKLTRAERAEFLRRQVDTVGLDGQPGGQIQSVIAVGMLSEGWDAKTVTHIMGLRAFTSQLLCEQVVGRGLRRTSYELNPETGLFETEYVNIFGVPFTFLPHESEEGVIPEPPKPKTRIESVGEKQAFEIKWPNVIRIEHVYRPRLSLDWALVEPLTLNAGDTRLLAELAPIVEGKPDPTKIATIDLEKLAREQRMQKIIFEAARDVYDQMQKRWASDRMELLGQLVGLVERFMESGKIRLVPALFEQDQLRRRLMLTLNMNKVVQHIFEMIRFENTEALELQFDADHPIRSTGDMATWYTGKPCEYTERSHINFCVFDSTWEASEAFELDRNPAVAAWVKNDHLGFEVVYVFKGVVRKYRPDFIIRLASNDNLILETKGRETEEDRTKRRFLDEWVRAVNADGRFGRWHWAVSKTPADVKDILTMLPIDTSGHDAASRDGGYTP